MTEAVRVDIMSGKLVLEGRFRAGAGNGPWPGVVICHPHPLFGGSMDNNVVYALEELFVRGGLSTLCFNFRGAGRSQGRYNNMKGETGDVISALSWLAENPEVDASRLGIAGYSFGGLMALFAAARIKEGNGQIKGGNGSPSELKALALVSPMSPSRGWERNKRLKTLLDDPYPALIVTGTTDRFCTVNSAKSLNVCMGMDSRLIIVEGADHFYWDMEDQAAVPAADFMKSVLCR